MPILPVSNGYEIASGVRPGDLLTPPQQADFSGQFMSFIREANTEMKQAEEIGRAFAAGETDNIHETMIATERAMIAFRLVGTVRNRLLEAYNEVMRMGI